MKKILAMLLVCIFAFTCVACGGGESSDESSKAGFTNDGASSEDESSEIVDDSSEVEDESSEPADESSEVSVDPKDEVVYTQKFMSWKRPFYAKKANGYDANGIVDLTAKDPTSLNFSKVNEAVEDYDIGIFTREYGATIETEGQDYANFVVAVFEYDHSKFGYTKTSFTEAGSADAATAIPEDGWVVVIYKEYTDKISAIKEAANDVLFYPHGIATNGALDSTIYAAETAPVLDGVVNAGEYGSVIWEIEPENQNVSYAQFEVNNYYATAEVYLTYDADKLYGAVVVNSPMHDCPLEPGDDASGMWQYECIQVNVSAETAYSLYMNEPTTDDSGNPIERWNNSASSTAVWENIVRQYGFAVSNKTGFEGETLKAMWMGTNIADTQCEAKVVRNSNSTVYEFAIPWAECGKSDAPIVGEAGTEFGFSLSVNCGNASSEDSSFKNITLRDGGGVIGLNDWTKVPVITLG